MRKGAELLRKFRRKGKATKKKKKKKGKVEHLDGERKKKKAALVEHTCDRRGYGVSPESEKRRRK